MNIRVETSWKRRGRQEVGTLAFVEKKKGLVIEERSLLKRGHKIHRALRGHSETALFRTNPDRARGMRNRRKEKDKKRFLVGTVTAKYLVPVGAKYRW